MPDSTPRQPDPVRDNLLNAVTEVLNALFGPNAVPRLRKAIQSPQFLVGAHPDIVGPPGTTIPAATEMTVEIETDAPALGHDVLLFQLPNTTTPIAQHLNQIPGTTTFYVDFAAANFVAGETYEVKVQMTVDPDENGKDTHEYTCEGQPAPCGPTDQRTAGPRAAGNTA